MQGAGPGDTVRYGRNQGRKSNPMFVFATAPACLLPLRTQGEEPTLPASPVPCLQQAGLLPAPASPTLFTLHHAVPVPGVDIVHQVAMLVSPPPPGRLP